MDIKTMTSLPSERALSKIVALAKQHNISAEIIASALNAPVEKTSPKENAEKNRQFLTGILAYLGGALIIAGLLIYAGIIWESIGSFPRVLLSLGSGVLAFIIAVIAFKDDKIKKAATPLWILAALLQPTGLFVFLNEYAEGDNAILAGVLVFGLMTAQYGAAFVKFKQQSLAFFTLAFALAFLGCFYEHIGVNIAPMWTVTGISTLIIAYAIHSNKEFKFLSPFWFFIGSFIFLTAIYNQIYNTPWETLIFAILFAFIWGGHIIKSRTVMFFSALILSAHLLYYYFFSLHDDQGILYQINLGAVGISVMLTGLWLKDKYMGRFFPVWLFIGSIILFSAIFRIVVESPLDILFPSVPAFILYISMRIQSRALLVSSILALLGFIGYFTDEYFADVVGWPIAMMVMGLGLIGLSITALKLNAKMAE